MKIVKFENGECKRVRSYLDSYLSNELMVETNLEVLKHLENCADCSREHQDSAKTSCVERASSRGVAGPNSQRLPAPSQAQLQSYAVVDIGCCGGDRARSGARNLFPTRRWIRRFECQAPFGDCRSRAKRRGRANSKGGLR